MFLSTNAGLLYSMNWTKVMRRCGPAAACFLVYSSGLLAADDGFPKELVRSFRSSQGRSASTKTVAEAAMTATAMFELN
jgi:hypothetical protein